jgi:hypothetical protein
MDLLLLQPPPAPYPSAIYHPLPYLPIFFLNLPRLFSGLHNCATTTYRSSTLETTSPSSLRPMKSYFVTLDPVSFGPSLFLFLLLFLYQLLPTPLSLLLTSIQPSTHTQSTLPMLLSACSIRDLSFHRQSPLFFKQP